MVSAVNTVSYGIFRFPEPLNLESTVRKIGAFIMGVFEAIGNAFYQGTHYLAATLSCGVFKNLPTDLIFKELLQNPSLVGENLQFDDDETYAYYLDNIKNTVERRIPQQILALKLPYVYICTFCTRRSEGQFDSTKLEALRTRAMQDPDPSNRFVVMVGFFKSGFSYYNVENIKIKDDTYPMLCVPMHQAEDQRDITPCFIEGVNRLRESAKLLPSFS